MRVAEARKAEAEVKAAILESEVRKAEADARKAEAEARKAEAESRTGAVGLGAVIVLSKCAAPRILMKGAFTPSPPPT